MVRVEIPRGSNPPSPPPPGPTMNTASPAAGEPYWVVWCVGGGPPTFKHGSFESADTEAKRLARLHCGEEFVVLESVRAHLAHGLVSTDLRPDRGIPF